MDKPLFSAVLEDGSTFIGGTSYFETKWKDIPLNKKIKRLFYLLPSGDYLALSKYDQYYHYVEVCQDLSGEDKGKVKFQFDCIMGKKDKTVTCYKINLKDKTQIECNIYNIEDKEITKLNASAWR